MLIKLIRAHPISAIVIGAIIFFITGIYGGLFIFQKQKSSCQSQYSFLNIDVVCGSPDIISKKEYTETRAEIIKFIEAQKATGTISNASVFFRDLKRGPNFGVNELADFAPASLLKLPLALVFLSSAENQPAVLTHKFQYNGQTTVEMQSFPPQKSAKPNQSYTIEELLKLMLVYSDNASYEALEAFLRKTPERTLLRFQTYQELGIIDPKDRIEEAVSVRGYSSLFRILYNVSYLNSELSEKVLGWLAESEFDLGLHQGVPKEIVIANKFGERFLDNGVKQLHDCGIIYYPENPYILCVMTMGKDFQKLAETIGEISKKVYEEVNSRRL